MFCAEACWMFRIASAIWSVPAEGGREQPVRGLEHFAMSLSWGVLEEGIYFIANPNQRRQTVRFLSFATHEVADVVTLEREPDWSFRGLAMSPDGRYLAYDLLEGEGIRTQRIWIMATDARREAG